jgi:hypothetical protein
MSEVAEDRTKPRESLILIGEGGVSANQNQGVAQGVTFWSVLGSRLFSFREWQCKSEMYPVPTVICPDKVAKFLPEVGTSSQNRWSRQIILNTC